MGARHDPSRTFAGGLTTEDLIRAALAEDLGDRGDITSALSLGGRGPAASGRSAR